METWLESEQISHCKTATCVVPSAHCSPPLPALHPCYTRATPTLHPNYTRATPGLHQHYACTTPELHPRYTRATPTLWRMHINHLCILAFPSFLDKLSVFLFEKEEQHTLRWKCPIHPRSFLALVLPFVNLNFQHWPCSYLCTEPWSTPRNLSIMVTASWGSGFIICVVTYKESGGIFRRLLCANIDALVKVTWLENEG